MSMVKIGNYEVDFDAAVNLMDDDIREQLHRDLEIPTPEQEFIDAYCAAHRAKFDEDFVVN